MLSGPRDNDSLGNTSCGSNEHAHKLSTPRKVLHTALMNPSSTLEAYPSSAGRTLLHGRSKAHSWPRLERLLCLTLNPVPFLTAAKLLCCAFCSKAPA